MLRILKRILGILLPISVLTLLIYSVSRFTLWNSFLFLCLLIATISAVIVGFFVFATVFWWLITDEWLLK
jgi:hypothetical protein